MWTFIYLIILFCPIASGSLVNPILDGKSVVSSVVILANKANIKITHRGSKGLTNITTEDGLTDRITDQLQEHSGRLPETIVNGSGRDLKHDIVIHTKDGGRVTIKDILDPKSRIKHKLLQHGDVVISKNDHVRISNFEPMPKNTDRGKDNQIDTGISSSTNDATANSVRETSIGNNDNPIQNGDVQATNSNVQLTTRIAENTTPSNAEFKTVDKSTGYHFSLKEGMAIDPIRESVQTSPIPFNNMAQGQAGANAGSRSMPVGNAESATVASANGGQAEEKAVNSNPESPASVNNETDVESIANQNLAEFNSESHNVSAIDSTNDYNDDPQTSWNGRNANIQQATMENQIGGNWFVGGNDRGEVPMGDQGELGREMNSQTGNANEKIGAIQSVNGAVLGNIGVDQGNNGVVQGNNGVVQGNNEAVQGNNGDSEAPFDGSQASVGPIDYNIDRPDGPDYDPTQVPKGSQNRPFNEVMGGQTEPGNVDQTEGNDFLPDVGTATIDKEAPRFNTQAAQESNDVNREVAAEKPQVDFGARERNGDERFNKEDIYNEMENTGSKTPNNDLNGSGMSDRNDVWKNQVRIGQARTKNVKKTRNNNNSWWMDTDDSDWDNSDENDNDKSASNDRQKDNKILTTNGSNNKGGLNILQQTSVDSGKIDADSNTNVEYSIRTAQAGSNDFKRYDSSVSGEYDFSSSESEETRVSATQNQQLNRDSNRNTANMQSDGGDDSDYYVNDENIRLKPTAANNRADRKISNTAEYDFSSDESAESEYNGWRRSYRGNSNVESKVMPTLNIKDESSKVSSSSVVRRTMSNSDDSDWSSESWQSEKYTTSRTTPGRVQSYQDSSDSWVADDKTRYTKRQNKVSYSTKTGRTDQDSRESWESSWEDSSDFNSLERGGNRSKSSKNIFNSNESDESSSEEYENDSFSSGGPVVKGNQMNYLGENVNNARLR